MAEAADADSPDEIEGEEFELDSSDEGMEETDDGGMLVPLEDDVSVETNTEHFANIADDIDHGTLKTLATDLLNQIEIDKEARKKRDEQYEEGLRRTGLGDDAPGGAKFEGASKVVHPMLTEASVDFQSRAVKELLPSTGPVKDMILGTITRDKIEKARRKTRHMNWLLTVKMPEFRPEMEQLFTQLPLGGSQYLKLGWDAQKKRPTSQFLPLDDVYIPFSASSFATAERKTHKQDITSFEFNRRVASGMYRDVAVIAPSQEPEASSAASANEKIEGKQSSAYNEDGLRRIFEVYTYAELEDSHEQPCPYVISIDETSQEVLSVYRNWMPDDTSYQELAWIVEFPFVPWRGAYSIGLTQMIGGLSAAATGALRALLDAALIQNFPGLVKLKGGTAGGQNVVVNATGVTEIEGSTLTDDIRKTIMPLPFAGPSAVLYSLLEFTVNAGKGVVRTTFENLADGKNPNMPVGTTLALIEQGGTVFSAIHARMHSAMQRVLEVLHRIMSMYLDEEELRDDAGEVLAYKKDYSGPMDVVPVSDPNIFSETQRFAQMQAVAQRGTNNPLYDQRKLELFILEQLKIPDPEELLVKPMAPKRMNAVNENVAASLGRPITAFPEQDHLAHIEAHLNFLQSPVLGMMVLIAPKYIPVMLEHLREHIVLWYATSMFQILQQATGVDPSTLISKEEDEHEDGAAFDQLIAVASQHFAVQAPKALGDIPQIIMKAIEHLQKLQPQPQFMDPSQAQMAETQRKTQADAQKAQADQRDAQLKQQKDQRDEQLRREELAQRERDRAAGAEMRAMDLQAEQANAEAARSADMAQEALRQEAEDARTDLEVTARVGMNTADNETAKELAAAEIISGERVAVSTGTGINPNP